MMTFEKEDIDRIIANYLNGDALKEEVLFLEDWINDSHPNKKYFLQLKNIWEVSKNQFNRSDIDTGLALEKVLSQISHNEPRHSIWFYWQKIAAILLVPIIITSLWWIIGHQQHTSSKQPVYNEVFANFGTRSALKLADGSLVWLNSGSSLKYPDHFNDKQRVVYLKGEAYFEVKADKTWPFIVQTKNLQVKATGTKFNVQAYDNDQVTEVSLAEGKVSVDKQANNGKLVSVSALKPSQHLVYNNQSGSSKLMDEDVYKYIAWKDGKLIFRNQPLSEVVKKISQLYNVEIELRGKQLQEYRYRATFQEESINEILKLLKLSSPIDYKEVARNPLPDGSFPKRKIIIFPVNESPKAN